MRTYFTFVFDYPQINDNTTPWTPAMNLFKKYPHLEGILSIECDIVGSERTKEFTKPDGTQEKWGYRLGWFEADDSVLANFGTSVADIISKAKLVLSQYEISVLSNAEVAEYLRKWTLLEEVEPGKFLIYPERVDMDGNTKPAEFIIDNGVSFS